LVGGLHIEPVVPKVKCLGVQVSIC
jgi:hypothetical protein